MKPGHTTGLAGEALREETGQSTRHAELFTRVMSRIYRYFRRVIWDRDQAEDLAQQTLLVLERSLRERTYDPSRSFNAWMWLKAHTVFAQWCRDRKKRMEPLPAADELATPDDAPRRIGERIDAEAVLKEVERKLGLEAYECFLLCYQSGLTQSEIAEITGRNRKTVAARVEAAHRLIDSLLKR